MGSANLTISGVTGRNIEAGMILDTRSGDPTGILDQIASAVDDWFNLNRVGLHQIATPSGRGPSLVASGVLLAAPPPATSGASGGSGFGPPQTMLQPLVSDAHAAQRPAHTAASLTVGARRCATPDLGQGSRPDFLFDPVAIGPTSGSTALSGRTLPGGAVGLILRLSNDDTRIFAGGVGTANVNPPTLKAFRPCGLGFWEGAGIRIVLAPEFDLFVRYLGIATTFTLPDPVESSVMAYGYLPHETGHPNVRMLLPAEVRMLRDQIINAGLPVPDCWRPGSPGVANSRRPRVPADVSSAWVNRGPAGSATLRERHRCTTHWG